LHLAQEQYDKFVISHIPAGVRTILDVGCGTGQMARELLDMGYEVDCVSPSSLLKEYAGKLLGNSSHIFECFYENLQMDKRYDLVLFCESFQYIKIQQTLSKTEKFLNRGGYLLICDVFRKGVDGEDIMSGGHKLIKFYDLIEKFPFRLIKDLDITEETAPNLDLFNDALKNVAQPAINAGVRFVESRHRIALKLLRWKYKKKINKIYKKYFEEETTGENFKKYKSYRLFLYKKDIQE
jgi:SAM-dependent methyltransferase